MTEVPISKKDAIEIKNPSKYMTITYSVSLAIIAILSIVVHLMLDEVIAQQSDTGKIVNVSGQQRMLSQRAVLFTLHYVETGSRSSRETAIEAINTMRDNQNYLLGLDQKDAPRDLSDKLRQMYYEEPLNVASEVESFTSSLKKTLEQDFTRNTQPDLFGAEKAIELAQTTLLDNLHAIVGQYEKESTDRIDELRFAQQVVFFIIMFTILVEAFFIFRPMVSKVTNFATRLQREANYDSLTNVLNRRAFSVLSKQNLALAKRSKKTLSIIMCDIDHFKKVNDDYGHAAGDTVIKTVALLLEQSVRSSDIVARYGGEEFIILLPNTNKTSAYEVAEKIRQTLSEQIIKAESYDIQVTVSLGINHSDEQHQDIESIINAADDALYKAKKAGRNQSVIHT